MTQRFGPYQACRRPILVAVVGGSGAGKTWLAEHLRRLFGVSAACLSLDEFYRDLSHLPAGHRSKVNFDHPRAIDWRALERALRYLRANRPARVPVYDFTTHTRRMTTRTLKPAPLILVDGLWLLRRPVVRRMFSYSVFLDCPARVRLRRRIERDCRNRGRTRQSVSEQFRRTVEPMHRRYVSPQVARADLVIRRPLGRYQLLRLACVLDSLLRQRLNSSHR